MKCYLDKECEASGICRSCFRPICENCAVKLDSSLVCPGKCEDTAKGLIRLVHRNIAGIDTPLPSWLSGFWTGLVLLAFGAMALSGAIRDGGFTPVAELSLLSGLICGSGFTFIYGAMHLLAKHRRQHKIMAAEQKLEPHRT